MCVSIHRICILTAWAVYVCVCVCFCVCMFVCLFVLACLHMSQCAYIGFWHRVLFIAVMPLNCVHVNWWVNSCVCVCQVVNIKIYIFISIDGIVFYHSMYHLMFVHFILFHLYGRYCI